MIPSDTLAALRAATAASHDAIDRQLQLGGDLSHDRYVQVLNGFERYLAAWEPHVAAALDAGDRAWFAARSRLPMLRRDLRQLDPERADAVAPPHLPPLPNAAAAWGSLYVLEGSALGGQLIARRVAERFGYGAANGAAFFLGHGDRTGAMWREFRERLDAAVAAQARDDACAAAVATFDTLRGNFEAVLSDEPV